MKGDHARFTWGLVSDIKKFMLNKNERVAFTSIVNDQMSTESKDFKMLTSAIILLSLLQFLADDMQGSQGEFFPIDTTGEVNEEEASEYYKLL